MRFHHAAALALSIAGLALLPGPAAAKLSRTAYFKVRLSASQEVTWSEDVNVTSCAGGISNIRGSGKSTLQIHTPRPQPAVAKRVGGYKEATLAFRRGKIMVPVAGTLTRNGSTQASVVQQGDTPCRKEGGGVAPDCGSRQLPANSEIGVDLESPQSWPYYESPTPLIPSIVLEGPYADDWTSLSHFQNCPGVNGDDQLRGPVYGSEPLHSSPGGLRMAKLFGTRERFTVTGHSRETVETAHGGPILNGTWPVTTVTHWTLVFRRLAHRPSGL
jgi:hypothetical protein